MDETLLRRRRRARFAAVAIGVALVGTAGYLGFVRVATSDAPASSGVYILGALTGFAAFFAPCSFPLLLTFLSRRANESKASALTTALRVGFGATIMLSLFGLIILAGGSAVGRIVQFDQGSGRIFRLTVGLILILLGLQQSRLINIRMGWLNTVATTAGKMFDPSRVKKRSLSDFAYGFGFLLAGFG